MSRRADSAICPSCQCRFGDSNCVHFDSRGPNDPGYAKFKLDTATTQLAESGPNGFGVFLPTWLSDPPCVSAYHSISQSVPYDTLWPLLFNKEKYDTDSMHSTDLQESSRLTFNTAGVYFITLNVTWNKKDVLNGDVAAFIRRDSSDLIAIESQRYSDEADIYLGQSVKIQSFFEAGQYVEALVHQDGKDAKKNPLSGRIDTEQFSPIFSAVFLRPEP